MEKKISTAILASGNGTNAKAILESCKRIDTKIIITNNSNSLVLKVAKEHNVPSFVIPHEGKQRITHELEILETIKRYDIRFVVLAGYMRVLTKYFLKQFELNKPDYYGTINIHPADTKFYQGTKGYEFALGLLPGKPVRWKETKITAHLVDEGIDTGHIIYQHPIPIHENDTIYTLKEKGLKAEHDFYPKAIDGYLAQMVPR